MLKRILVPVRGDGMVETVLAHAAVLARRHAAEIVVAHCRAQAEELLPYNIALPAFARNTVSEQVREAADQQEAHLREEVRALAERLGLAPAPADPDTPCISLVEEEARMADVIKQHGRLADLVVVAKPDRDRNLGTNALKSALFQTGRPVLMCPRDGRLDEAFDDTLALAWNGSLEATRAVAMTLDLAGAARRVTILAGGKGEVHGAGAEALVVYYARHGIAAGLERFEARNPGRALLEKSAELGAGLLIMGGYGQTHERETLFGGNTQTVVDTAERPVLFVH